MSDKGIIFSAAMVQALLAGRKTQTRRLLKHAPAGAGWYCDPADTPSGFRFVAARGLPTMPCLLAYAVGDRLYVREACCAEELSLPPMRRAATRKERALLQRTSVIVCDEMDGTDGIRYLADEAFVPIENNRDAGDAWSALFHYACKNGEGPAGLRGRSVPSIHMPRWASRLTLIVTDVRVERVQQVSWDDAIAEGIERIDDPRGTAWKSYETCPDGTPHPHASVPNASPVTSFRELWDSLHRKDGETWADNPFVVALTFDVIRQNIDRIAA